MFTVNTQYLCITVFLLLSLTGNIESYRIHLTLVVYTCTDIHVIYYIYVLTATSTWKFLFIVNTTLLHCQFTDWTFVLLSLFIKKLDLLQDTAFKFIKFHNQLTSFNTSILVHVPLLLGLYEYFPVFISQITSIMQVLICLAELSIYIYRL